MKKYFVSIFIAAMMISSLALGVSFFSSEDDPSHPCADKDCLPCTAAAMVNDLPDSEDITIENAAAVMEQINQIDRIKGQLDTNNPDDEGMTEYDHFIAQVEGEDSFVEPEDVAESETEGKIEDGKSIPKYDDVITGIEAVEGGDYAAVQKAIRGISTDQLDWSQTDATFSIECIETANKNVTFNNGKPLEVTLGEIEGGSMEDKGFYSKKSNGWTNTYMLPEGTYKITEIGSNTVTVNGNRLNTTASYNVDGEKSTDCAVFTVAAGEEATMVRATNVRNPQYTVSFSDQYGSDVDGVALKMSAVSGEIEDIIFDDNNSSQQLRNSTVKYELNVVLPENSESYAVPDNIRGLIIDPLSDFPDLYINTDRVTPNETIDDADNGITQIYADGAIKIIQSYTEGGAFYINITLINTTMDFSVVDGNDASLAGTTFTISDDTNVLKTSDGKEEWTYSEDETTNTYIGLKTNKTYKINATQPKGYTFKDGSADELTFTTDNLGVINSTSNNITISNNALKLSLSLEAIPEEPELSFLAVDADNNNAPLAGAHIQILSSAEDGKEPTVIIDRTSDETGEFTDLLETGDYTLVGMPPDGYYYNGAKPEKYAEFPLKIDADGNIDCDVKDTATNKLILSFKKITKLYLPLKSQELTYGDPIPDFLDYGNGTENNKALTSERIEQLQNLQTSTKTDIDIFVSQTGGEEKNLKDISRLAVGSYTIKANSTYDNIDIEYNFGAPVNVTINPKPLTADDFTVTFEGTAQNPSFKVTIGTVDRLNNDTTGLEAGDDVTVDTADPDAFEYKIIGNDINCTIKALSGTDKDNYSLPSKGITKTINGEITGDGTEGDGTEGDGTEGDGTEGDGTEGDGTEGDGTEGDGTEGDGTEGDGTEGDGTEGDGTEGDGTEGDGTEGDGNEDSTNPPAGGDGDVAPINEIHTHTYKDLVKENAKKSDVTCTKAAVYYKSCECGEVSKTETFTYGNPAGHKGSKATCIEKAYCIVCKQYYGDALGHQWSKWTKEDGTYHIRECTRDGCGHAEMEAHSPDLVCGSNAKSCTVCGATAASEHKFDLNKWKANSTNHWHECIHCGAKKDVKKHDFNKNISSKVPQTCPTCKYGGHITRVTPGAFDDEDIPESLRAVYQTVDEIKGAMKTKASEMNLKSEGSELYDAILEYSVDGGKHWYKASESYFPKDGRLPVKMEVPKGTDIDKHNYTVLHMFSSNAFGKTAGDIETPKVFEEKDADGKQYISFYVTGLSPIMVAWEDAPDTNAPDTNAGVESDGSAGTGDDSDMLPWVIFATASALAGVAILLQRKKKV